MIRTYRLFIEAGNMFCMKILCINIDSDTESWRLSQEQFEKVGLNVERVSAITGDNRPLAFNQSVLKAMGMAATVPLFTHIEGKEMGRVEIQDLLLFEDDVMFDEGVDLRGWPQYVTGAMPGGWMTLHLGCNIIGTDTTVWQMPAPHSEHLGKLWNCWQSHATLYSAECVKFVLENLDPNVLTAENPIFDEWLRVNVLPMGRSYVMKPMIAFQRPRFSEIWQVEANYTGAHTKGNEILSRL